jgi:hypothetical protein
LAPAWRFSVSEKISTFFTISPQKMNHHAGPRPYISMENYTSSPQSPGGLQFPPDIWRLAREKVSQGKLLDIRLDIVFKTVFSGSSDDSQQALKSLLSACVHRPVSRVKVLNSEITPEYLAGKTIRLDVHATFNNGQTANLEMQMERGHDSLKARAAFYAYRLAAGQGKKGKYYRGIKRVYQIFFLNIVLFPGSGMVPRRYALLEKTEHDQLNDQLELCFYELPKLEAKVRRVMKGTEKVETLSPEEMWCIFFMCHGDEGRAGLIRGLCRGEEGIMRAEKVLSTASREYEEWAKALFREKAEMDYRSEMYASHKNGYDEGVKDSKTQVQAAELRVQAAEQRAAELERKLRDAGL